MRGVAEPESGNLQSKSDSGCGACNILAAQQLVCNSQGGGMNLTEFEDIVNLSEKLLEQTKNNIMTVDEFGYWTEGILLVERIFT